MQRDNRAISQHAFKRRVGRSRAVAVIQPGQSAIGLPPYCVAPCRMRRDGLVCLRFCSMREHVVRRCFGNWVFAACQLNQRGWIVPQQQRKQRIIERLYVVHNGELAQIGSLRINLAGIRPCLFGHLQRACWSSGFRVTA